MVNFEHVIAGWDLKKKSHWVIVPRPRNFARKFLKSFQNSFFLEYIWRASLIMDNMVQSLF